MPFRPALGVSDFRSLRRSGADYIDKSGWIEDVLTDPAQILLLPRPRRFGKTLNLSTLRYFLEKSTEDRTALFEDLEVWRSDIARARFQRHPVLWITFKDVKFSSWEQAFAGIRTELQRMYEAHRYLIDEGFLSQEATDRFRRILRLEGDEALYTGALRDLSEHLFRYHGEQAVILIDEYDTPIHTGFVRGYYDPVSDFFRALLSSGLKDNPCLLKGVLTGILRVSKESLFSGLNNIIVYSILSRRHSTAFGFTEAEVEHILDASGESDRVEDIRTWYNGYLFAGTTLYNPWSVLSFIADEEHRLRPYWLMTGSDELLRDLILHKGFGLSGELETLLHGGSTTQRIDENIVLRDVDQRSDALWSFLLFSGYLKPLTTTLDEEGVTRGALAIPNREVRLVFKEIFLDWLSRGMGSSREVEHLTGALLRGDVRRFERLLATLLLRTVSTFDPAGREPEKLYHGFILGLLVSLEPHYEVRSNRESGFGRADVLIRPKQPGRPGVVLELKVQDEDETVDHALQAALDQLRDRRYAAELEAAGAHPVYAMAAVFDGKRAWVRKLEPPSSG